MSDIADKWGIVVAQRGFAQIPNYLMLLNTFLADDSRCSPTELMVLLQLVGTWWKKDDKPFPSMRTLALRCGVSERQMARAVGSLVYKGLLTKTKRRTKGIIASNAYDMQPLVDILNEISKIYPNEYVRKIDRISSRKLVETEAASNG